MLEGGRKMFYNNKAVRDVKFTWYFLVLAKFMERGALFSLHVHIFMALWLDSGTALFCYYESCGSHFVKYQI